MKLKDRFEGFKTEPQKEFDWGEMEYIARLEKALDKACELLEKNVTNTEWVDDAVWDYKIEKPIRTKEEWKEYLFNED